jgi:isocitrate dehydrogenase
MNYDDKLKMSKINFRRNKDPDMVYKPKPIEYTYYQICQFPKPNTNDYAIRRLKINENYEFISIKEKDYNKKKIQKFIEKTPENKFSTYPTFNIKSVGFPNPDQIICANSELLK